MNSELTKAEIEKVQMPIKLIKRLFGPAVKELGELIADWPRSWRLRNLLAIQERLERKLRQKGIDRDKLHNLSLSIGLPMLEKASYQEDPFLQEKWANLMATGIQKGTDLHVTFVGILNRMNRLDCEVLEYVCEEGVSHYDYNKQQFTIKPDVKYNQLQTTFREKLVYISIDNLQSLGIIQRTRDPRLIAADISELEFVIPSVLGINL